MADHTEWLILLVMTRDYHAVLYFRSSDRVKRVSPNLKSGLWFTPPTFIKSDVKLVTSHTRPFPS